MGIKHAFTSAVTDGTDDTLVQPSDWNADHVGGLSASLLTTAGDLLYQSSAVNYATSAYGASASCPNGGNIGVVGNIIDGDDATYFGTYNFVSSPCVIDLGVARTISTWRVKVGYSYSMTSFKWQYSTNGTNYSDATGSITPNGGNPFTNTGSMNSAIEARYWKFLPVDDNYSVSFYTLELKAAESATTLAIGSAGKVLTVVGGAPSWEPNSGPWIIDVFVFNSTGNTNWTTINRVNSQEAYGQDIYSSGAQNAARWWDIYIPAGTWTFILRYVKASNQGIYDVQIDGSSVGTIDGYASGTTYDNTTTITGISVATSGKKTLKLLMSTKNASASAYYGEINHVALHRTA